MGQVNPVNIAFQPPPPYYTPTHIGNVQYAPTSLRIKDTQVEKTFARKSVKYQQVAFFYFESKIKGTKTTLIYSHGNACDIGIMYGFMKQMHLEIPDINILIYDYLGYGLSDGVPNEQNAILSIEAVIKYLFVHKDVTYQDIILFGKSLGSGLAVDQAVKHREVKGLILESAFTSACRVVLRNKFVNALLDYTLDIFVNLNKIGQVKSPVYLIHGQRDQVVPFDHSKLLWEQVPNLFRYKYLIVKKADHNNVENLIGLERYFQYLKNFVAFCDTHKNCSTIEPEYKIEQIPALIKETTTCNTSDQDIIFTSDEDDILYEETAQERRKRYKKERKYKKAEDRIMDLENRLSKKIKKIDKIANDLDKIESDLSDTKKLKKQILQLEKPPF